jgi:hypothetical protein
MKNALFVLSGNSRTFIDCVDSMYTHVISKLFTPDVNIFMYLYLKLTDPGPKGQKGFNFEYKDCDYNMIVDKIHNIKTNYPALNIDYKILPGDEITDNKLISQVKDRRLYRGFYEKTNILLRGLHCHYNLERCGQYILEKETHIGCKFDYIIYVRPDLYFVNDCNNIETYNTSIVTLGIGPNEYNNDHIAIVPRPYMKAFFFNRMNVYRVNTRRQFISPEEVYWCTIKYEVKQIGEYYIKRA